MKPPDLKKIATNLPDSLLREAVSLTGLNQTQTLIKGLEELIAKKKREELLKLEGRIKFDINLDRIRKRIKI